MDEVTSQQPSDDTQEMAEFGLDANNPADVQTWQDTTGGLPRPNDEVTDYSQDSYEIGGLPKDSSENPGDQPEDTAA